IMYLVKRFLPSLSLEFGVFLPLMAVNSLLALHCERVAVKRTVKDSFLDAVSVSVSYGAVTVVAGFLREILGSGTIGGADIHLPVTFSVMLTPFGGLLVLGFSAALLKSYIYKKYPQSSPDAAFNTSEVRQSLKGTLRELMNDDYNPYDEGDDTGASSGDADAVLRLRQKNAQNPKKEKTERPKREKSAEKKQKPEKKNTLTAQKQKNEVNLEEIRQSRERTYLDDFSDMLTDLENYKQKEQEDVKGGDGK
nr:hypothetical protein [Oscillospiraceae bacterium]